MQTRMGTEKNRAWEYILVAYPDEVTAQKIVNEKSSFLDTYGSRSLEKIKPHIEIAHFLATESMEETIIRWIQRICSQFKSFEVTLNNFSGFPPGTIYVRVQDPSPFRQLAAQLKVISEYLHSNGFPEVKFLNRPHVPIARGIADDVYGKAMPDYSRKSFHEIFWATELVLLKRNNQFDECRQVNLFRFYPPDTNMYGQVAQQLKHQPL